MLLYRLRVSVYIYRLKPLKSHLNGLYSNFMIERLEQ